MICDFEFEYRIIIPAGVYSSHESYAAVEALLDDRKTIMIGIANSEIVHVPLNKTVKLH